jgi:hypothetical protein
MTAITFVPFPELMASMTATAATAATEATEATAATKATEATDATAATKATEATEATDATDATTEATAGTGTSPTAPLEQPELGVTLKLAIEFCLGYGCLSRPPLLETLVRKLATRWNAVWIMHPQGSLQEWHSNDDVARPKSVATLPLKEGLRLARLWLPYALQSVREDLDAAVKWNGSGMTEEEIAPGRDALAVDAY